MKLWEILHENISEAGIWEKMVMTMGEGLSLGTGGWVIHGGFRFVPITCC